MVESHPDSFVVVDVSACNLQRIHPGLAKITIRPPTKRTRRNPVRPTTRAPTAAAMAIIPSVPAVALLVLGPDAERMSKTYHLFSPPRAGLGFGPP
jgi:hypothetical protein